MTNTKTDYKKALEEIENKTYDKNLWAQMLIKSKGNEEIAKSLYIKYRFRSQINLNPFNNLSSNEIIKTISIFLLFLLLTINTVYWHYSSDISGWIVFLIYLISTKFIPKKKYLFSTIFLASWFIFISYYLYTEDISNLVKLSQLSFIIIPIPELFIIYKYYTQGDSWCIIKNIKKIIKEW